LAGKKILVADDEPKILKAVADYLKWEGFEVYTTRDGDEVLREFKHIQPDLLILDITMPKTDGFEVCRKIREESKVPIIFLSAKASTIDKITGLTLGSDDYLTKPFDNTELLLRIKAVLRRTAEKPEDGSNEIIKVPGLVINREAMTVELDGEETELTSKEFDMLWLLANRPNKVFTREQLLDQVWGTEYYGDTGVVTTLIKRLREKIEPDTENPKYIKTIRGVGYKFGVKPC
jgi:DNA-binding response OmpR family regulator